VKKQGAWAIILLFVIFVIGTWASAADDDERWSVTLDSTFNSKYVWRGLNLADDFVWQPSMAITYKGLTFTVWTNMNLTETVPGEGLGDEAGEFTEVDLVVNYDWSYKKLNLGVGILHYMFPNTDFDATTELSVTAGLDVLLSPCVTLYQDVDVHDGTYVSFGASHSFVDVLHFSDTSSLSIDLSAVFGAGSTKHNGYYHGVATGAFSDVGLTAAFPVTLSKAWSITPSFNYASLLDKGLRDATDKKDNVWLGISLTYSK